MQKMVGILHFYMKTSKNPRARVIEPQEPIDSRKESKANEIMIVGDEEGLYQLWLAAGEVMLSKAGKGSFKARIGNGLTCEILLLRVERKSHFLKQYPTCGVKSEKKLKGKCISA